MRRGIYKMYGGALICSRCLIYPCGENEQRAGVVPQAGNVSIRCFAEARVYKTCACVAEVAIRTSEWRATQPHPRFLPFAWFHFLIILSFQYPTQIGIQWAQSLGGAEPDYPRTARRDPMPDHAVQCRSPAYYF
jgi:hypothetical protein